MLLSLINAYQTVDPTINYIIVKQESVYSYIIFIILHNKKTKMPTHEVLAITNKAASESTAFIFTA